jgi:hypothetical protein
VINGKSISSSDVIGQVALQSRHEVRPLPKRLDFGKSRHEINGNASFSDARCVEELHELCSCPRREDWVSSTGREDWVIAIGDLPF